MREPYVGRLTNYVRPPGEGALTPATPKGTKLNLSEEYHFRITREGEESLGELCEMMDEDGFISIKFYSDWDECWRRIEEKRERDAMPVENRFLLWHSIRREHLCATCQRPLSTMESMTCKPIKVQALNGNGRTLYRTIDDQAGDDQPGDVIAYISCRCGAKIPDNLFEWYWVEGEVYGFRVKRGDEENEDTGCERQE